MPGIGTLVAANALGNTHDGQIAGALQESLAQAQAFGTGVVNQNSLQGLSDVIQNGIALPQMSDAQAASALSVVGNVAMASLGGIPRAIASIGIGAASGALVGGPWGALAGAVGGAIQTVPALFAPGPRFNPPSQAANENLTRLRSWQLAHPSGLDEPFGWHFYDYLSKVQRTSALAGGQTTIQNPIVPVCTSFLFGGDPGLCSDVGGFQNCCPPIPIDAAVKEAVQSVAALGRSDTANFLQQQMTRMPDPAFYACLNAGVFSAPVTITWRGNGVNYAMCVMLGTIVAMLEAGASDQSIAAELILQQDNVRVFDGQGQAMSLQPLVDVFLHRLQPRVGSIVGGTLVGSTASTTTTGKRVAAAGVGVVGLAALGLAVHAIVAKVTFVQSARSAYQSTKKWVKRHT